MPSQLSPYPYGNYSDPYSRHYSSNVGYYSAPPAPAPALVRLYYDRVSTYGGSSAPVDCSSGPSYEQKAKGGKLGMGASLAVGAVVRAPSIGDACRPGRQRAKGRGRGSGRRRASGRVGIGADIFKRALSYPSKLIAKNAGINGDVVVEKVLSSNDVRYGYNAAKNCYEDLMAAGILDPTKVVRCCVEHAAAVAKTFLTSDVVVVDTKEAEPVSRRRLMPTSNLMRPSNLMPTSNFMQTSNLMPKSGIAL